MDMFKVFMENVRNVEVLGIFFQTIRQVQFLEFREQQAACLEMDFFSVSQLIFVPFLFILMLFLRRSHPACLCGCIRVHGAPGILRLQSHGHSRCQNIFITPLLFYQIKHYQANYFSFIYRKVWDFFKTKHFSLPPEVLPFFFAVEHLWNISWILGKLGASSLRSLITSWA